MVLQAEKLRSTALRKQAGDVLAAWRHELQQKQAARLVAQELLRKACRVRAAAVLAVLRQLVCLSAEAEKGALALSHRRDPAELARPCWTLASQRMPCLRHEDPSSGSEQKARVAA